MDRNMWEFVVNGMANRATEILAIHAYLSVMEEMESPFGHIQMEWHRNRSVELQDELDTMQRGVRTLFGNEVAEAIVSEAVERSGGFP